jgi:CRP/FNR family transcriptional regulator, cyclic AMP receptor protein
MAKKPKKTELFGVQQYLSKAGVSRRIAKFKKGQVIFSQDDPCDDVLYIQSGNAELTIVNPQGKEAVLAIAGPVIFWVKAVLSGTRYAWPRQRQSHR